jgi:hypothetical protein
MNGRQWRDEPVVLARALSEPQLVEEAIVVRHRVGRADGERFLQDRPWATKIKFTGLTQNSQVDPAV